MGAGCAPVLATTTAKCRPSADANVAPIGTVVRLDGGSV